MAHAGLIASVPALIRRDLSTMLELVSAKMPELTDEQLQKRLVAAICKAAEVGLTGIRDAGMDLRIFALDRSGRVLHR